MLRRIAELPQFLDACLGEVDVELLEPVAVVLDHLGTYRLTDSRKHPTLDREWSGFDNEVGGQLVGMQVVGAGGPLQ